MTTEFTPLLDNDPRAREWLEPGVCYAGARFKIWQWIGNEGNFFDLVFPKNSKLENLPSCPLFVSGGCDAISEDLGVWFGFDADHPRGARFLSDGSLDSAEYLDRSGRQRFFLKNGTNRLCIVPVDAFGGKSLESIDYAYMNGPCDVTIPQDGIFVLSEGAIEIGGTRIIPPGVVEANSSMIEFHLPVAMRGIVVWKS